MNFIEQSFNWIPACAGMTKGEKIAAGYALAMTEGLDSPVSSTGQADRVGNDKGKAGMTTGQGIILGFSLQQVVS
jgi:hypothetical protein